MENNKYAGGNQLLDAEHLLKEVLQIPYGSKVADLGCGSMAFFTMQAAKLVGDQGLVYACDILKDVLSSVESKSKQEGLYNIKTVWTNLETAGATRLEFLMDYVLLVTTLFQATNHQLMISEAFRLLNDGGQMLLVDWKKSSGPVGPAMEKRVDREQVKVWCEEVGFKLLKEFEAGASHYGFVFEK